MSAAIFWADYKRLTVPVARLTLRREFLCVRSRHMRHDGDMISVIIPTLNAERLLPRCFDSLIGAAVSGVVREVIVADGGSTDATLMIADAAGAHIVHSRANRGAQLADGARMARKRLAAVPVSRDGAGAGLGRGSGILPRPGRDGAAARRGVPLCAGGFRRRGPARRGLANLRAALFALPYGDQGLLIPKRLYQKLGGYRALADLEDADLVRRIGRRRLVVLARPRRQYRAAATEHAARRRADACCTSCACRRGCLANL